jgi:hypothetical protein
MNEFEFGSQDVYSNLIFIVVLCVIFGLLILLSKSRK